MKHTIRRYGQLEEIDCEFGSDVFDKNGRVIFEGDLVKFANDNTLYRVEFSYGIFRARTENYGRDLHCYSPHEMKVVDKEGATLNALIAAKNSRPTLSTRTKNIVRKSASRRTATA